MALAYALMAAGFGIMSRAGSMRTLFPAVMLRSVGSAAMWVYSTLLLQFRVPNAIQGGFGYASSFDTYVGSAVMWHLHMTFSLQSGFGCLFLSRMDSWPGNVGVLHTAAAVPNTQCHPEWVSTSSHVVVFDAPATSTVPGTQCHPGWVPIPLGLVHAWTVR